MNDEKGYIKFNCNWIKTSPIENLLVDNLNTYRSKLYTLGFIGVNPDGIGFGNMSIRQKDNNFIITGTATGGMKTLAKEHFTLVNDYNFDRNWLLCQGPIEASSESLTHAAVYESDPETMAVIHIHSNLLWSKLKHKVPTSKAKTTYGTPEMAFEIKRLFKETNLKSIKTLVMAGHEDGIITFGTSVKEAFDLIVKHLN